jgi:hypothetical protein
MAARFAAILMLAAGAWAQAPFEVSGTVTEPGVGGAPDMPVAGAEVILMEYVLVDAYHTPKEYATAYTDGRGAYVFRPDRTGDYYLEVKKDGYKGLERPGDRPVKLTRDRPRVTANFRLWRPGELTGRVVDENDEPVPDLMLSIRGKKAPRTGGAITAEDGLFAAADLAPGEYIVQVAQPVPLLLSSVQPYDEAAFAKPDERWEPSYWPGGGLTPDPAAYVPLRSGGSASVGTIRVRKVPHYRARVRMAPSACGLAFRALPDLGPRATPDDLMRITAGFSSVPCADDLMVEGLLPGRYWFAFWPPPRQAGARGWALAPVEITNANVEVVMTVRPAVDITGRVIAAEGSEPPPFKSIAVSLRPLIQGLTGGGQAQVTEAGEFTIPGVPWPEVSIDTLGLLSAFPNLMSRDATHYVASIRYNGREVSDGVINPAPGAELEIVIADRPATLTGTITNGDSPTAALVAAVPWPMQRVDPLMPIPFSATSDGQGRFQLRLPPGEYRILAVPPDRRSRLGEPGVLNLLAASAERVTLDRGDARVVELRLLDPGR